VHHILSKIHGDEDRRKLRLVSKTWFDWISLTYFTFGVIKSDEMPLLADILSKYTKPIGLNIVKGNKIYQKDFEQILRLTNLTSFSIDNFFAAVPKDITKLTNLVSLNVNVLTDDAYACLDCMTQLTKLKVSTFMNNLPNLVSLNFSALYDKTKLPILSKLTALTTSNSLSQPLWESLARNSPLKRLEILSPDDLPPEEVVHARAINGLAFTSLESLETGVWFDAECLQSDTLTRLIVRQCVGLEAGVMFSHLTNLKELHISSPDPYVFKYFTQLSKLESLALTGNFSDGAYFAYYMVNPLLLTSLKISLLEIHQDDIRLLKMFTNLLSLNITTSGTTAIDFTCLSKLSKLTNLSIECEQGINKTLQWTTSLPDLEYLHLVMPGRSPSFIAKNFSVTSLTRLTYLFCRSVAGQIDVQGLTNLRELMLTNLKEHIDIPGLESLRNLTNMITIHPMPAEQWQSFLQLTKLQSVYIECEDDDADEKLDSMTVFKRLSSLMCMQSTWNGANLTRLTSLQSITFGTKNPVESDSYGSELRGKMPLLTECTYFGDFLSSLSSFWGSAANKPNN
jgi:hypothetical protein